MTLRLILGDQLNLQHPLFAEVHDDVVYVMMELRQETDYVRHHWQKLLAFFEAMRLFAQKLQAAGHRVHYLRLGEARNTQSLSQNLDWLLAEYGAKRFEYFLPDEYRLDQILQNYCQGLNLPSQAWDTAHFYSSREALAQHFKGKKTYLMESFYRTMRRQWQVLMQTDGQPEGGQWNYDAENRKAYKGQVPIPEIPDFSRNLQALEAELQAAGVEGLGQSRAERFPWPLTREEGLALLAFFCRELLPYFGQYQDAMTKQHRFLFHSRLSFVLNVKLLSPKEVVDAAVGAWRAAPERIGLAQVEGFVRQILGWREYMRGIYWAEMPRFAQLNYFGHERPLPAWFWTGQTKMNCLKHSIQQSLEEAYAHHIQRLMVTGNFALLAGISPDELDQWYLGIYIDAIEWVEITNTRGMSQFADGGLVGSKPYTSSANYLDKMSDYCRGCAYKAKQRSGQGACPFNSLYWDFHARHRALLERNPRIGMVYRLWDKMPQAEQAQIRAQAAEYLANLEAL